MREREGLTGWLRGLARREPDANLSDEVRFHLEMQAQELVRAGMTPERAAEEARKRFGGVDRYTEELRDERSGRLVEVLAQDARYAMRVARRFPGFTAIVVATLGFAIGANTAIFSVVDAVLLRPLPFANPEEVVLLFSQNPDASQPRFSVSYADFLDWRAQTRSFDGMAAFTGTSVTLLENAEPERLSGLMASSNLFTVLGMRPALGRSFGPEDERGEASESVLLSDEFWRRRFGADSSVIGRSIQFTGRARRVIGVLPPAFRDFAQSDVVTVLSPSALPNVENHGQHLLSAVGRLNDGVTLEQAQQDLRGVAARLAELHPSIKGWSANVFRASDEQTRNVRRPLWILFAAAALVLLIGCINVANLLITRATSRGREVALRQALGASRSRLVSQLLVESAMLAIAGGVLGVALGAAGTRVIARVAPPGTIPRLESVSIDARVLVFALVLSVMTALIVGLWPAFRATTPRLAGMLRDGGRTSAGVTNAPRMRRTLVVAEISLAVVLLVCSGLVLRSLGRILSVEPGFQIDNVMTMRLSPTGAYNDTSIVALYRNLTARLAARPGIQYAAAANTPPLAPGGIVTPIRVIGRPVPPNEQLMSAVTAVTPDYFRAAGIPLVRGRDVAWSDPVTALVVSETAAKTFWPDADAIGKRIAFGQRDTLGLEVIGIVKDSRARGLTTEPEPMIYMAYSGATNVARSMTLVVRGSGDEASIIGTTRAVLRELDPRLPLYNMTSLRDIVDRSVAQPRLNTLLLGVFAGMAALLAGIGIYGVIAFSVAQRTQEIGVRMALGASQRQVLGLVLREGTVLGVVGVIIGLIGAAGATRLIQSWLFGIGRSDPATLAGTAVGVLVIALMASLVPARRAMRVDPLLAMRAE